MLTSVKAPRSARPLRAAALTLAPRRTREAFIAGQRFRDRSGPEARLVFMRVHASTPARSHRSTPALVRRVGQLFHDNYQTLSLPPTQRGTAGAPSHNDISSRPRHTVCHDQSEPERCRLWNVSAPRPAIFAARKCADTLKSVRVLVSSRGVQFELEGDIERRSVPLKMRASSQNERVTPPSRHPVQRCQLPDAGALPTNRMACICARPRVGAVPGMGTCVTLSRRRRTTRRVFSRITSRARLRHTERTTSSPLRSAKTTFVPSRGRSAGVPLAQRSAAFW